ncbi:hypothetical protein G3I60_20190 [Streptomyces sp. SID13666]|uniref:hypothetical protein n=1 Tax=Streptomyces sp. SID13666 TaxID=2706054 RepID=UPI0013C09947|nr:hypothetical protein [Streptomyces sp. SID13666]NEA56402.1 hypothetical protein [Streptomyces sp. SID13666]
MLNDLDQAILFTFATLVHESETFTTALVTDELTDREQEHLAKRLVVLADALQERAELTRKRRSEGNISDINSARGESGNTKAG